jgi:hypothetical protein
MRFEVVAEFNGTSWPVCHYDTRPEAEAAVARMKQDRPWDTYRILEFETLYPGKMRYTNVDTSVSGLRVD